MSDELEKRAAEIETPSFDLKFQACLIKLALIDDHFCTQLVKYLSSDEDLNEYRVFDTSELHFIFTEICKSFGKYKTRPTEAQLRTSILEFQEDERDPFFKTLDLVMSMDIHNQAFFRDHIAGFVRQVKLAKVFKKTRAIWRDRPEDSTEYLQKVIDDIRRVSFEKEDVLYLDQVFSIQKTDGDTKSKIPTGLTRLDEHLRGGLPREALVTVLGATNAGKSIFCTSLGCSALRNGFKVLHLNLEGARDEAIFRYASNLANVPFQSIEENSLTQKETERVNSVIAKYNPNLKIRHMVTFGETIENVISTCREDYKNFPFDILIVDYGQLLETKSKQEKFEKQTAVYRGLASIAMEHKCVVISPAQSTREGIRKQNEFVHSKNRDQDKLPILRSSDLADCIEIAKVSSVILTLNRTEEEERAGMLRVFLEKQRRGAKAVTFGIRANYPNSNLIINDYYEPGSVVTVVGETENNDNDRVSLNSLATKFRDKKEEDEVFLHQDEENLSPLELEYNELVRKDELLVRELDLAKKEVDQETDGLSLEKLSSKIKEIKKERRKIKEKAIELLPKFMPTASSEFYKLAKDSIRDKTNNSCGTPIQNAKTRRLLKQLSLVYG